eukprot:Nitzschia sp. Nitz4//scaffold52_size167869//7464//8852//NITZ4_002255-RA/size167869-processed-gene-0.114-mRNA-1//-1//CDS//3329553972//8711//frame0
MSTLNAVDANGSAQIGEIDGVMALPAIEKMLVDSIVALQPESTLELEEKASIAKLVYDSMTTHGRVYHSMQHVFDISRDMKDPILVLSALFHDVIYFSIDKVFSETQKQYLEPILVPDAPTLTLVSDLPDELIENFCKLYGFAPGEPLPSLGTNEFLSGVIGVRVLSKWLSFPQLMEVATCIEATIPFRPVVDGKSPMDRLYDRLKSVCPDQSEEWLVETVRKAAATANFDLCSFDSTDRDFFLDSSWKLMPEARPSLLREDCPLSEWMNELKAIEGRTKFLIGAVPKIFQSFRQVPSDDEMDRKRAQTHNNLDVMYLYLKVRQLQAMVLVSIVEAMCEDPAALPLRSCLSVDIPELSEGPREDLSPVELEVRSWLVGGRKVGFEWDPAVSPLGAFLYDSLGPKGVEEAVSVGHQQQPGSHELLKFLPQDVVVTITSRLGEVFTDGADRCSQIPEKLGILAQ